MICNMEISDMKCVYNCIYMYVNKINNKKYIGQTTRCIYDRHRQHMTDCYNENKKCYNHPFYRAVRKYTIENFEIIILKQNLTNQCLLNLFECYYIKKYNTMINGGYGYNVSDGGSNGNNFAGKTKEEMSEIKKRMSDNNWLKNGSKEIHPMYGKHHSEGTKEKISKKHKGKQLTNEHKKKTSNTLNSRTEQEKREWKNKIKSTWQLKSENEINEIKKRMSMINSGENNYWFGKHHTEETKKKLSEANSGIKHPKTVIVVQLDKNMNLIKIWNYIKEIELEKGWCASAIGATCRGKQKTAYGFNWMYFEKYELYKKLNIYYDFDNKH